MNNKHIAIKREEIEVGMAVAYPYSINVGWHRNFRYPAWVGCVVERVTPKRTKTVISRKDGSTIDVNLKEYSVYVPDELMTHENECVQKYKDCRKILSDYDNGRWKALWELSDDELKEAHTHLMELSVLFQKTKE